MRTALPGTSHDFNPRSLHGERQGVGDRRGARDRFQSTLPARGATVSDDGQIDNMIFQSTLPARGATRGVPRMRRPAWNFNPRSLHGERRHRRAVSGCQHDFNPRSLHGERHLAAGRCPERWDFNPRSLHGERRAAAVRAWNNDDFNPRSLHGERRSIRLAQRRRETLFQSTLPARGATPRLSCCLGCCADFNPRSLHGERRRLRCAWLAHLYFNPRSLHGERRLCAPGNNRACDFNPRSLHGERRSRRASP